MTLKRMASITLLLLLVTGCESFNYRYSKAQEARLISRALGGEGRQGTPELLAQPLTLSPAAIRKLDDAVSPSMSDARKLDALRHLLFDKDGLGLSYDASRTKTATEIWDTRTGNCLSLTNLWVAAARHVGLQASFEMVQVTPSWDFEGGTMVRYDHIVATGRLGDGKEYVVDFLPEFAVGDRRASRITDEHALALYYINRGAESILAGDYPTAVDRLRTALHIAPAVSNAWNNLGTAFSRMGDADLAEFSYQRALHLDRDNYSALSNLAQFYVAAGRPDEAKYFQERVQWYRDHNPYFAYFTAHLAFTAGDYKGAIKSLERAVALKPEEPAFYEALAKCYEKLGDDVARQRYLAEARQRREEQALARRNRNAVVQMRRAASHIQ